MQLTRVVLAYYTMGAVMLASGVIPYDQVGLVDVWLNQSGGGLVVDSGAIAGQKSGMLSNLIGPVRNALGTIAGGSLLAVWGAIDAVIAYYAWPMTVAVYLGAPMEVVLIASVLVVAFTFAVLSVFRASV